MTQDFESSEMVKKSELVNMGRRFVEVQMQNVDLEQDMAIMRKKFRDLLTQKGQPEPEGGIANIGQSRKVSAVNTTFIAENTAA